MKTFKLQLEIKLFKVSYDCHCQSMQNTFIKSNFFCWSNNYVTQI